MKLFKTLNLYIGPSAILQEQFWFELPSVILSRRKIKFEVKFGNFLSIIHIVKSLICNIW